MILTRYALEQMGFSECPESDVLEIQFGIVRLYSIQGINFSPDSPTTLSQIIEFGENCSAVISNSVNEACRALTREDFIDEDEKLWIKRKEVNPPFVLIYFKESKKRTLKGGRRKEHNGSIICYDAFPEGKKDIQNWEKESLPSIVTALVVHLSTLQRPVQLIPVQRAISGKTERAVTVFDIKMTGRANIIVSSGKTSSEIDSYLLASSELFKKLDYKTSRHFYSAHNESDRLKQFLSFFMFIERHTHKQFQSLNYESHAKSTFNVPERLTL